MEITRSYTIPPKSNPWVRLAAAMVNQAVRDLHGPDQLKALDALGFFVDGDCEEILSALDVLPKGDILEMAVNHGS